MNKGIGAGGTAGTESVQGDEPGVVCPNCGQEMRNWKLLMELAVCDNCELWGCKGADGNWHWYPLKYEVTEGECPNCAECPAWEQDRGYNIPQAGVNSCPVCGREEWFVANRCNVCDRETCPSLLGDPVWAPGLAILDLRK